ncbi:hypothetical protein FQR65_LT20239 [Abscondita terminalis]|nr:hypothetical protein FQR65_LT20239 [Abscondita terminalis]
MMTSNCRVGVDIGGTFTDIALDVNGVIHSTKVLTDYEFPEQAILKGLFQVTKKAGVTLADIDQKGAKTAFITTEGFRDTLEMRTENRFEQYDINISLPPPLIEREHRYTLKERIGVDGHVLIEPQQQDIDDVVGQITQGNYESVAIGFIHSYMNGEHELKLREALVACLPQVSISISSEVSPQMREFERFNTVCANAYVKPMIQSYLDRLVVTLKQEGAQCPVFMIHSGGGIISIESAAEFPVRLVESGPAGGAIFAADIARKYSLDSVVSFDMGGTTAKICLIEQQVPKNAKTFRSSAYISLQKGVDMPISICVEMVEIGAGGRLDASNFAGGAIQLSEDHADEAMASVIGNPLQLATKTAAYGVCEVVDENMANAGRVHAVESGKDISDFTMITLVGGGPLHAARLCEKMGNNHAFIVPCGASIRFLRLVSYAHLLAMNHLIDDMTQEAISFLRQGMPEGEVKKECTAFMRYVGQGWEIPVQLGFKIFNQDDAVVFKSPDVEIVSWSVKASSPLAPVVPVEQIEAIHQAEPIAQRKVFDVVKGDFIDANIYQRENLNIGAQVMWNRLVSVVEEQALTLIRTAFSTSVREAGDLSAGVFDREGRMIAQAVTGTPGHVNTMAEAVVHFINDIGTDNIYEGDVYVTNDPWKGTGHLHDITIVSPSFYKGKLIGYFASTAHVVDIGGRGFGPDAREVYEEGLFIPVMKLFERGKVNKDLVNLIRHNVRENERVIGDFYALSACNETGHLRLIDMLREFNLNDLDMIGGFILEHSRKATLDCFKSLPHGQYTNSMTLDRLRCTSNTVSTSDVSQFGINVPLGYAKAYACYALKCILAPEIPNNTASLEPFEVAAPEGCLLNAKHPAPVSVRHVLGHFVPDLVLGALHKCLPGTVPAEGASALWNLHMSVRPLATNPNGPFPSGVHTMPVEATEHAGPVIVWRKEFRNGSGGAGALRGGLGQEIEISASEGYEFRFSAMFDRIQYPARGREGGFDGTKGFVGLDDGTVLRGKGQQQVPATSS